MSHEKKTALLSIESWLFHRDPYNGLLKSPYNWAVLNNQGIFNCTHAVDDSFCSRFFTDPDVSETWEQLHPHRVGF